MPQCTVSHGLARPANIYYELHGQGPMRVALVMGFGTSLEGWRMQVDHFLPKGGEFTVLVLDNRGCGRSSVTHWVQTIETMARDLICVLDQLGWSTGVNVVGISMGGMIAMEAVIHSHGQFDSLTLVNTHAGGLGSLPQFKGLHHFTRVFTSTNVKDRTEHALRLLYGRRAVDSPEKMEILRQSLRQRFGRSPPTGPKGLFNHFTAVSMHWVSEKRLRRLGASGLPILIIVGTDDNLIRPSNSFALHAAIGTSRLRVFEGCGHGLIAEVPDEFNAVLEEHIRASHNHAKGTAVGGAGSVGVVVRPIAPVADGELLSGLDALFLVAEAPQQVMTISGFCVLEKEISREGVVATFDRWTRQYPRLRQTVSQRSPLRPWFHWVSEPNFKVADHVNVFRLSNGESVQDCISRIVSSPLDRSKPLWDTNLIVLGDGARDSALVQGASCVLLTRLHHAVADGGGSVQMMLSLVGADVQAQAQGQPHVNMQARTNSSATHGHSHSGEVETPARAPNAVLSTLVGIFWGLFGAVFSIVYYPLMAVFWALAAIVISVKVALIYVQPGSPFVSKKTASTEKRVAWTAPIDLAEVKQIGKHISVSVNDVLLSCVAGAIARTKRASYVRPDATCMVPFNMRGRLHGQSAPVAMGNHSITVWCSLPLSESDPIRRTLVVKRRMDGLKKSPESMVSMCFSAFLGYMPAWLARIAIAPLGSKAAAVITNVPGPQRTLQVAGEPLKTYTGIIPVPGDNGVGMTIFSYDGRVTVSVHGDATLEPSVDEICAAISSEFAALKVATAAVAAQAK